MILPEHLAVVEAEYDVRDNHESCFYQRSQGALKVFHALLLEMVHLVNGLIRPDNIDKGPIHTGLFEGPGRFRIHQSRMDDHLLAKFPLNPHHLAEVLEMRNPSVNAHAARDQKAAVSPSGQVPGELKKIGIAGDPTHRLQDFCFTVITV